MSIRFGNALTAAAYDGNLCLVTLLLDAGAEVNSPNGWALQAAAGEGHEEIVALLLKRGADVNACSDRFEQSTALQAACEAGIVDIVETLLDHKANPDLGAGYLTCPIIAAARKGEPGILELLVKAGAKVNIFGGPDMSSPLINAAIYLPKESLEMLINEGGADVNMADNDGDTALIMAAIRGDTESVEFLLQYGADVRAVSTMRGINALQAAYRENEWACAGILIDHVSKLLEGLPSAARTNNTGSDEKEVVPDTASEDGAAANAADDKAEEAPRVEQPQDIKQEIPVTATTQPGIYPSVGEGYGGTPYKASAYMVNTYEGAGYGTSYGTNAYGTASGDSAVPDGSGHAYGTNLTEAAYASNQQSYAANAYNAYSYAGTPHVPDKGSHYGTGQHDSNAAAHAYASPPPETSASTHSENTYTQAYASPSAEPNPAVNAGSAPGYGDSAHGLQSYAPSLPGSGLRRSSARKSSYGFGAIAERTESPPQLYGSGSQPTSPPTQSYETLPQTSSPPAQPYGSDATSVQQYGAPSPHRASSYGGPEMPGYNSYGAQPYNPGGYAAQPQEQYGGSTPPTLRVGYGAQPPPIPRRKPVPGQGGYASPPGY